MQVLIHCSASSWGNAVEIDKWHRDRGFDMIGYHYVILNGFIDAKQIYSKIADGLIETGRRQNKKGAHTRGHNNKVGICLIGNPGEFTQSQYDALNWLLQKLQEETPMYETFDVEEHSDVDPKKPYCASIDWNKINF